MASRSSRWNGSTGRAWLLILLGLAGSSALINSSTFRRTPRPASAVTASDTEFPDSNWLVTTVVSGGASQESSQVPVGGNLGAFRGMRHIMPAMSNLFAYHVYIPLTYDPASLGPIDHVDFAADQISPEGAGIGGGFLVVQNNRFYTARYGGFFNDTWVTVPASGLKASDFEDRINGGSPDFSGAGGSLRFGYTRANSNPSTFSDLRGRFHGIDNWSVTVVSGPAGPPTPGPSPTPTQLAASTTTLISQPNPSAPGDAALFTTTVTGSRGVPSGFVVLYADGAPGASQRLDGTGRAAFRPSLPIGHHVLFADYLGDTNYTPSRSPDLVQSVECLFTPPPTDVRPDHPEVPSGGVYVLYWTPPPNFTGRYIVYLNGSSVGTSISPAFAGMAAHPAGTALEFKVYADPLCGQVGVSGPSNVAFVRVISAAPLPTRGPIRRIPNLRSIDFVERTLVDTRYSFAPGSPSLERLSEPLTGSNSPDFTGADSESYDVFYSDSAGRADPDGAFLTIEAAFSHGAPLGGGLNIERVVLNFADGHTEEANSVASFAAFGDNADPITVFNAVDGDIATATVLGNTVGRDPSTRLRLTLGVPLAQPAPGPCPTLSVLLPPPPAALVGGSYPASLPSGTYSFAVAGGTAPYNFSIFLPPVANPPSLPPGLHLLPSGLLYGTPARAGDFPFTLLVHDARGCGGSQPGSIHVDCGNPIKIEPPQVRLLDSALGLNYDQPFAVLGGSPPYSLSFSPGTPPGLGVESSADGSSLRLRGMPTAAGDFRFTITAATDYGCSGSADYILHVGAVPEPRLRVSATDSGHYWGDDPDHRIKYTISYANTGSASAANVRISSGFDAFVERIAGGFLTIPDLPAGAGGTFDAIGQVRACKPFPEKNDDPCFDFSEPSSYLSYQILYLAEIRQNFAVGQPDDRASVLTPYCASCACPVSYLTQLLCPTTFNVFARGVLTQVATEPAEATLGLLYGQRFSAVGGTEPYTFSARDLPPGLSIDPATGVVRGTPTLAGPYRGRVGATDADPRSCQAPSDFGFFVCPAGNSPVLSAETQPYDSCVRPTQNYRADLRVRCNSLDRLTVSLVAGQLPPGLRLENPLAGHYVSIAGTPEQAGTFDFTLEARDDAGHSDRRAYSIDIRDECPSPPAAAAQAPPGNRKERSATESLGGLLHNAASRVKQHLAAVKTALHDISLYYKVRDRVLQATPGGRRYIQLYYRYGSEIVELLKADGLLRDLGDTAMTTWEPQLQALVDGQGSSVQFTSAMADSMTALLEALKQRGSMGLKGAIESEQRALNLSSLVGMPMDKAADALDHLACGSSDTTLCLNGGRFRVEASWKDFQGNTGVGHAVPITGDTGSFWFFNSANVELVTKALDGRAVNGKFWFFYGSLSNVEYTITVTDTSTGAVKTYVNPSGTFGSAGDTNAFEGGPPSSSSRSPFDLSPEASRYAADCSAGGANLCLNGGRFRVEVSWKDFQGNTGVGHAVPLTGDTGYFWFFDSANVELVVKALDGRGINGKFWVFYGALSNVEYTVTVTDTQTGAVKTYRNPSGVFASVGDTTAF